VAGPAGAPFRVALTFDAEHPDRPHRPLVADGLLDALAAAGTRSTWFLQGRWVEAFPELARRVATDGHLIGNHSFYHARLPLFTDEGLAADIRAAETVIRDVVGVDPRPWFRCPFGAGSEDPRVLGVIDALGYRHIGADVSLEDWAPYRTGPAIVTDALAETPRHGDGAVVLFHSWPPGTLDALPALIAGLRDRGATFVTLAELERFTAPDHLPTESDAAIAS
jgi:peptidoglycan/xylan/chitin deacetylase (PgdA/CDA1 family)